MAVPKCSDQEFIRLAYELQSADKVAKALGVTAANGHARWKRIEHRYGIQLPKFNHHLGVPTAGVISNNRVVVRLEIQDGTVVIGSDAHIWPGPRTTMQRAFIEVIRRLKPFAVIANGDFFDGARVSRFDHSSWSDMQKKPSVKEELDAVKDYMGDVELASPASKRIWNLGNHDARYEARLVSNLPEYVGVQGTRLKDHFPNWLPAWRVDINDKVVVKHRGQGGEHADWNNVLKAGRTIVTGHDHRAGVTPYHDYNGIRWGVRCGYMAESPMDPQFVDYLEASEAVNWHPAFVVLTFRNGRLLWPELVTQHDDGVVEFRGELIEV